MKNTLILLSLLAALTLPPVAHAQLRNPMPTPVEAGALTENHTIRLSGHYGETLPIDFTMTGVGPSFFIEAAEPNIKFQAVVTQQKDKLHVNYNLSASVPIKSGANTVDYRSVNLSGSVRCDYGKPLSIASINQKKLEIMIQKTPQEGTK